MSGYVMRPAKLADFDALMCLAEQSGAGFTSLPVDEERLRDKLEKSLKAFAGDLARPEYGKYLLMLEELSTGKAVGCSAVKCGTGINEPFFNYRIITVAQASQAAGKRFDLDALVLTNEFVGYTEVGTLFIQEKHRGGGIGRLAAQARYMLMASDRHRFGEKVLAELRGVVDENGETPFWDCLGKHFFQMTFQEADHLSAISDNQFILDLMPKYPIYVDLLPPAAREVIGRCNAQGIGAMKLLEWEGFRFERTVDIFDGGPMVAAHRDNIRTIRESRLVRVQTGDVDESPRGLISSAEADDFRAMQFAGAMMGDDGVVLPASQMTALGLREGDAARIWIEGK